MREKERGTILYTLNKRDISYCRNDSYIIRHNIVMGFVTGKISAAVGSDKREKSSHTHTCSTTLLKNPAVQEKIVKKINSDNQS